MPITLYIKEELQLLKKRSSEKAKEASNNSSNAKPAPQNILNTILSIILFLKNIILLLESANRLLKDDIANKQKFIDILLNFNENKIQSRDNKNISSSLIQKNTNTGNNNAALKNKGKPKIKNVSLIKNGTIALENKVATENVAKTAKENLRRKLSLLLAIP